MNQHASRKWGFILAAVFIPLFRSSSAWNSLFAGGPSSKWVPQVTMALLYGVFFAVGFFGEQFESAHDDGIRFPAYMWGFGSISIAIGIVALAFIGLGYGLIPFGLDVAYSIIAVVAVGIIAKKAK